MWQRNVYNLQTCQAPFGFESPLTAPSRTAINAVAIWNSCERFKEPTAAVCGLFHQWFSFERVQLTQASGES